MSSRRAPAPPPTLPGYRFLSVLGSGGFSDVYLYEQDRPRRKVAVKVLTADLKTAGARSSFESEANLMAQLSAHPYIVTIFEAEITDAGHSYLAMEYCSRPSLDLQYRQGRSSVDKALEIGIQVASAVETAHRAGIAHRDIKPANVLVTDYNRPALTDFGISDTTDSVQFDRGMSIPWSPLESADAGAPVAGRLTSGRSAPPSTRCWPGNRRMSSPVPTTPSACSWTASPRHRCRASDGPTCRKASNGSSPQPWRNRRPPVTAPPRT